MHLGDCDDVQWAKWLQQSG